MAKTLLLILLAFECIASGRKIPISMGTAPYLYIYVQNPSDVDQHIKIIYTSYDPTFPNTSCTLYASNNTGCKNSVVCDPPSNKSRRCQDKESLATSDGWALIPKNGGMLCAVVETLSCSGQSTVNNSGVLGSIEVKEDVGHLVGSYVIQSSSTHTVIPILSGRPF